MNKINFTTERVHVSCWTIWIWKKPTDFFYAHIQDLLSTLSKNYYFNREFQQIFKEVKKRMNIEFISCLDFDLTMTLQECLLTFDDSCEEFTKINTLQKMQYLAQRNYRGINSIFVKHNLYHQSKWSRTIDLNTTHIILFNSPRDTQQIEYLGRQKRKLYF